MKKKLQFMFTALAAVALSTTANAQCPAGQGQLDVDVTTDGFGYEFYFEITPAGDACGTNTVFAGGNATVGCAGGGAQAQDQTDPGLYADNTTVTENVGCFPLSDCFTLTLVDDWGDGGTQVDIKVDGVVLHTYTMGGADANVSYNFCMQQMNYDLKVNAASKGNYFGMIPDEHAPATILSFSSDIENGGVFGLTNVVVTAVVNDGTIDVHTSTSTPITLPSSVNNNVALSPDYTLPSTIGSYTVTYTGSSTEADEDLSNNTLVSTFDVTDSVLSRVSSPLSGVLGIGAVQANGKLGQTFSIPINDTITSISAFHSTPTAGDSTKYAIWDMMGGQPGSELTVTDAYVFSANDALNGVLVTLDLPVGLNITANTGYVVMAYEYNNNLSLGTEADNYEIGTNWVAWDSNNSGAWANGEDFNFPVNYALYINFGNNSSVQQVSDLKVNSAFNGNYYKIIPNEHASVTTLSFSSDVENIGGLDLTNVVVTAVVNDGATDVHTAASASITLAAAVTSSVVLTPGYTLVPINGTYTVTYTGSSAETDVDMNNNTLVSTFEVADSVLSRAPSYSAVTGAYGITAPPLDNGKLGQTFAIPVGDVITSISGFHMSPTSGDSTKYAIWDVVGGQPNTELAVTDAYVFSANDALNGVMVTLSMPAGLNITANSNYVVMAYQYNSNLSLGTVAENYEMGTNWIAWDSQNSGAWANGESFGSSFAVNYALYVNFGDNVSVTENTLSDINVYPNPSKDFVNVQLTEDVNNATVVVYAMDGSIVSTKVVTGSLFTVDVQDFANGIYMVEIRDKNNTGIVKIIKE